MQRAGNVAARLFSNSEIDLIPRLASPRLSPSEGERTEERGSHFSDATLTLPSPLQRERRFSTTHQKISSSSTEHVNPRSSAFVAPSSYRICDAAAGVSP